MVPGACEAYCKMVFCTVRCADFRTRPFDTLICTRLGCVLY